MATSNQILAASSDKDLEQRFTAIAAKKGIPNPKYWVQDRMMQLANAVVQDGQTIADVYAYAEQQYKTTQADLEAQLAAMQAPGRNLAAVTDTHLGAAIDAVNTPQSA